MNRMPVKMLVAAMLMAPSAAPSQQGAAPARHDSNAPVDLNASQIEVDDRAGRVVLTGNVVARQLELTLRAARANAVYVHTAGSAGSSNISIQRIDAAGGVTVTRPNETARGDSGIYDLGAKIITLVGNVHLTQGASNISGGRLVIDLNSGRAVVSGGAANPDGGRVTGHFLVPRSGGTSSTSSDNPPPPR